MFASGQSGRERGWRVRITCLCRPPKFYSLRSQRPNVVRRSLARGRMAVQTISRDLLSAIRPRQVLHGLSAGRVLLFDNQPVGYMLQSGSMPGSGSAG